MTGHARKAGFMGEVVFGLGLSLVTAAVAVTLSFVMPAELVARLIIAALGLTVVLRAMARSDERTGRVVAVAVWAAVTAGAWFAGIGLPAFLIVQATMVWLARSLFCYSRLVEAAFDLALTLLAVSFAVFAAVRTESVFLASWCFLLVQAFHVSVPALAARCTEPGERELPVGDPNRGFADAFRAADEALHRIAGQR